jgi:hypothetical protein
MKLLIVGPDMRDLHKVKNFTGVQAFYLARELRRRGVELCFVDGKHPDPLWQLSDIQGAYDHALALGLRWFTHRPAGCATILKTKVKGAVTQLHDGVVHSHLSEGMIGVDCTFMFRDDRTRMRDWVRYCDRYHYIGWAADPDVLYPEQRRDELRILLDHPYYKSGQPDITEAVTVDATMFAHTGSWQRYGYKTAKVRRLVNGGAEDVTINDPPLKMFDRRHVSFPDIAQEYRRTHIYCVTHKESVGLTCLELAYCGAFVVAPKGMIYQDRLETVRHIQYEGVRAPWGEVLPAIDIQQSRGLACEQTWDKVTDRMLQWFGEYRG